jgi:homoserine dehydrogenase
VGVRDSIVVLKFGSSVLRAREDLPSAVHEIYRWYRDGHRVIAVVSAIGDATDLLLASARDLASSPEPYALAELLATGERAAAALLGVALDRVGVRARVVDPRTIGLLALGTVLDSEPVGVNREQLKSLLTEFPVLLVPGFFGYDEKKRPHSSPAPRARRAAGSSRMSTVCMNRIRRQRLAISPAAFQAWGMNRR